MTSAGGKTSGLAIASMVLSLGSCLIPFGFFGGVICGHLARGQMRRDPSLRGAGFATTGLIAGYILGGLVLAWIVLVLAVPGVRMASLGWRTKDKTASQTWPAPGRPSGGSTRPSPGAMPGDVKLVQPADAATGKIGAHEFTCEDAELSNGWLTLRQGKEFLADAEVKVVLFAANRELEGKAFTVGPAVRGKVPHVHMHWNEGGTRRSRAVSGDYTMTLRFEQFEEGKVRGEIDLKVPNPNGATVKGKFVAKLK